MDWFTKKSTLPLCERLQIDNSFFCRIIMKAINRAITYLKKKRKKARKQRIKKWEYLLFIWSSFSITFLITWFLFFISISAFTSKYSNLLARSKITSCRVGEGSCVAWTPVQAIRNTSQKVYSRWLDTYIHTYIHSLLPFLSLSLSLTHAHISLWCNGYGRKK